MFLTKKVKTEKPVQVLQCRKAVKTANKTKEKSQPTKLTSAAVLLSFVKCTIDL